MPLQEWQTYPLAESPEAAISTGNAMPWQSYQLAPEQPGKVGDLAAPTTFGDILADVGKQAFAGPIAGIENMAAATPRLMGAAAEKVAPYIESAIEKVAPGKAAEMREGDEAIRAFRAANPPPSITDYLPEAKTLPGQLTRGAGEFIPAMMGAPGNLARNAVAGAVAGLSSEGAGQLTKGTEAEPYARIGAGLVGGMGAAGALAPEAAALSPEQVLASGKAAYEAPEVKSILVRPAAAQRVVDNVLGDLDAKKLNVRRAPETRGIIEDFKDPIGGALHSVEDYQTTRELLGKVAGNYSNPTEQFAATEAIKSLDKHFGAIPQDDLASGNIAKAVETLTGGRADYAAGKAAERVQQRVNNAELQTASAYSGGNIDNATRQKLRPLLTSQKGGRGLTPEELDQIDQVVRGSPTGNVLRTVGSALGGKGGFPAMIAAGEGMRALGPLGAIAPLAGYGVKRIGDALTTGAADKAVQQILSRAPSAAALKSALPPSGASPRRTALINALLANQPQTLPLAMPNQQEKLQQ